MLDNEMPGAQLEAPDTFQRLAAPLWPRLPLALGYSGGARWVALYVQDDKLRRYDGEGAAKVGETSLFLAYKRHPVIAPCLARAHLGSADEPARAWLLVDQAERVLYLAPPEAARRHLAAQWPRWSAPLEYTPAELARLLAEVEETALPLDWAERLEEAVRESRANYRLMQQWLDQHRAEHHL
jgi:hypothetical protein